MRKEPPLTKPRISSMGELVCNRTLEKTDTGFVPGQHHARIIDPRPHRDRGDLAAVLTYVDDAGMACDVLCIRYRDPEAAWREGEDRWHAFKIKRAGLRKSEPSSAVNAPALVGVLLETIERAADDIEPFPFENPSEDEQAMRRLAHKLIDRVERRA